MERQGQLALLSLVRAERLLLRHWLLDAWGQGLAAQPLLLPVSFKLPKTWSPWWRSGNVCSNAWGWS